MVDDPVGDAVISAVAGGVFGLLKAGAVAGIARLSEALAGGAVAASEDAAASALGNAATSAGTNAAKSAGNYFVYQGTRSGGKLYIGITRNWAARSAWHWAARGRTITPIASGLTYQEARGAEQLLIDYHGLGNLDNLINSISFSNPNFQSYVTQGLYALQGQGAAPF